jgi:hypothetical protein
VARDRDPEFAVVNDWLEYSWLDSGEEDYEIGLFAHFKDKSLASFPAARVLSRHDGFWLIDHRDPLGRRAMALLAADQVKYFTTYEVEVKVDEDTDGDSSDHGVKPS